jgi:hypothetical protein
MVPKETPDKAYVLFEKFLLKEDMPRVYDF